MFESIVPMFMTFLATRTVSFLHGAVGLVIALHVSLSEALCQCKLVTAPSLRKVLAIVAAQNKKNHADLPGVVTNVK